MTSRRAYLAALVVVLLAGASLRVVHLGRPALCCDEFYDAFAAHSWLDGHGFNVPGREYTRARLMVLATAASFTAFGRHEWSARLPALVFGLLTLGATWWMARALFGRSAALAAVALVAISPDAIDISRFARLYAPLTFFVLIAAVASFETIERGPRWPLWGVAALSAELLATHFHPVALTLGAAVCLYAAVMSAAALARRDWLSSAWSGAIAIGILAVAVAAAQLPSVRATFVRAALEPLPWYRPTPGGAWVHHVYLRDEYGWLWIAVWAATAVAIARAGRAGLFVALAFWVPFALISIVVATKHHRYTLFLLPFAWVMLGVAVATIAGWWRSAAARRYRVPVAAAAAMLVATGGPAAFPSFAAASHRPWRMTGPFATGFYHDWRGAAAAIGPLLPPDALIVSDQWHASMYYLHRPSMRLYPADRDAAAGDWETISRRADIIVQHAPELVNVQSQRPIWVVVSEGQWQRPGYYDPALVAFVRRNCRPAALPPSATLVAFDCTMRTMYSARTAMH